MFVDELEIYAKAGDGGDGVVRWLRTKFVPKGGPSGGNGGKGADVYVRAVRDLNILSKYTGSKEFIAPNGEHGRSKSQFGAKMEDLFIDVPVGSIVTDIERNRVSELSNVGDTVKILNGGAGGLGNEHFKSSVNRSPQEATSGRAGEEGHFRIELQLIADVGLIGLPNAGKSTLLNLFTNATSKVGAYPFTTTEPHLGSLYGFNIADIPGLIEGAAEGKGLGHKFLRHITRTKMLLHLVSLGDEDPISSYVTVKNELGKFNKDLLDKEEWIIFTKKDLVEQAKIDQTLKSIDINKNRVFIISSELDDGVKELRDALVQKLTSGT